MINGDAGVFAEVKGCFGGERNGIASDQLHKSMRNQASFDPGQPELFHGFSGYRIDKEMAHAVDIFRCITGCSIGNFNRDPMDEPIARTASNASGSRFHTSMDA